MDEKGSSTSIIKNRRREYSQLTSKSPKPPNDQILIKSSSVTFNHFYEFTLDPEYHLWIRRRKGCPQSTITPGKQGSIGFNWAALELPFNFDSTKCKEVPTDNQHEETPDSDGQHEEIKVKEISADGEYLVLIDNSNEVYLRRVLKGSYSNKGGYTYTSTIDTDSWEKIQLQLPDDYISCAISYIPYANSLTLYVLERGGCRIRLYDMFSSHQSHLWMPESCNTYFQTVKMDAGGATVAIIGYEHDRRTGIKQLKVYTRPTNINTSHCNTSPDFSRMLPLDNDWQEHTVPGGSQIFKDISIFRDNRYVSDGKERIQVLHVPGLKGDIRGYYTKTITDGEWVFTASSGLCMGSNPLSKSILYTHELNKLDIPICIIPNLPDMSRFPPTTVTNLMCKFKSRKSKHVVCLKEFGFHRRFFKVYFYPYRGRDLTYSNRELLVYILDRPLPVKFSEKITFVGHIMINNQDLESDIRIVLKLGPKQLTVPITINIDITVENGELTMSSRDFKPKFKITNEV